MTSPIHLGLSPAGRVLLSAVLVGGVATAPTRAWPACAALAIAVLAVTRPRLPWLGRRVLLAVFPIVALVIPIAVHDPARAAAIGARASAALLVALGIASTLDLSGLPGALRSLGAPQALAATIHTMLWQLEHVGDEGRRLLLARRLRGCPERVGPDVLAQLLIRTTARAERVDLAMRLRGADAAPPARRRLSAADLGVALFALAVGVALHVFG